MDVSFHFDWWGSPSVGSFLRRIWRDRKEPRRSSCPTVTSRLLTDIKPMENLSVLLTSEHTQYSRPLRQQARVETHYFQRKTHRRVLCSGPAPAAVHCRPNNLNLEVKHLLGSGAVPQIAQVSSCVMRIMYYGRSFAGFVYPFPVIGSYHKLHLARKSLYIEIGIGLNATFDSLECPSSRLISHANP